MAGRPRPRGLPNLVAWETHDDHSLALLDLRSGERRDLPGTEELIIADQLYDRRRSLLAELDSEVRVVQGLATRAPLFLSGDGQTMVAVGDPEVPELKLIAEG